MPHRLLLLTCYLQPQDYVNTLLVPKGGHVNVDREQLAKQGIMKVVNLHSISVLVYKLRKYCSENSHKIFSSSCCRLLLIQ